MVPRAVESPLADGVDVEIADIVRVSRVALRDFRNVRRADLSVPAAGVVLVGGNGHGKTNFLEAVHYAHAFRSPRAARDTDLIRFGAEGFFLALEADGAACQTVSVGVARQGGATKKKIVVDGVQVPRVVDALGAVSSVVLAPIDVALVAGPPSERRRYLDIALGASSQRYVAALQRYRTTLQQRNAAIRDAAGRPDAGARLAVWEPALAESGGLLWAEREAWFSWAAPQLSAQCALLGERGQVTLALSTHPPDEESRALESPRDPETFARRLERALARERASDLRRGLTQSGPHRDDLLLQLDGRLLRSFGSAGQQRCAAAALRLIERDTVQRRTGRRPALLLDDPFAELDPERAECLLRLVADGRGQVLLAVPRGDDVPDAFTLLDRWEVRDGVITT